MAETVSDLREMLRLMSPRLEASCYVFRQAKSEADLIQSLPMAIGMFREAEAVSLIVPAASDAPKAMRLITLQVNSELEAVGLTAAVSAALSDAGIPCNIVAAFAHDHVFVPVGLAEAAVDTLRAVSRAAAKG